MATVTSSYAIGVTIDADGTGFVTGTEQAQQAMQDLATTTQTAATDIDTSLATDVPASVDSAAVGVTTKASKFKAVGTELGTNLVDGIAGGASAPEAAAGLGTSLSGLLAASATTGAGAIAAVGIGIGGALIGGLVGKMRESSQQITDSLNEAFRAIEVQAKETNKAIIAAYDSSLSFKQTVADAGGGDETEGWRKLSEYADYFHTDVETIVQLINHEMNPATRDLRDQLGIINKHGEYWAELNTNVSGELDHQNTMENELGVLVDQANEKRRITIDHLKTERNYQTEVADQADRANARLLAAATNSATLAANLREAAAAGRAVATGLQDAAAASLGVKFGE